jgi:hypothetical protein
VFRKDSELTKITASCNYETHLRMLRVKVWQVLEKNNHRHLDRSPIDAEVGIFCLQTIL